jgi:putative ABC transport system ATP-binding protein
MQLLRHLCDELGQTTLFVTHDPRAATYADRVVFIKDGAVLTELSIKDLPLSQRLKPIIEAVETYEI